MKRKISRYLSLAVLILPTTLVLKAQNNPEPERFHVHFNKEFYVSGERIWFTIYMLNKTLESEIVHAGLFDPSGKLLIDEKLPVHENCASGSFEIPVEWPDGWYGFRVITRWNLNFGREALYEKILPVFNSSMPVSGRSQPAGGMEPIQSGKVIQDGSRAELKITFNKNEYSPGDSVSIMIESASPDNAYQVSISVLDLTQRTVIGGSISAAENIDFPENENISSGKSLKFKPEKNPVLELWIRNQTNSDTISSNVISLFLSSRREFIRASATRGKLAIELPELQDGEFIQVLNLNPFQEQEPEAREIKIWEYIKTEPLQNRPPFHTPETDQYIFNVRLRRKLNEIFFLNNDHSSKIETPGRPLPPPDMHYDMSNFRDLKDLEEFIKMIMLTTNYSKESGRTTIRLQNEEKHYYFMRHPWYIADGLISYQEEEFLSTPFSSIASIDLYNTAGSIKQWDPLMIQNGIIAITTDNRYWENKFLDKKNVILYDGIASTPDFNSVQPELQDHSEPGPDMRPVVFWSPSITVHREGSAQMRFVTTDNPGNFLIRIEGVSSDGNLIKQNAVYEVRLP